MSPADSLQILEQYAVVILPVLVVAEQVGIPLPAVPALLGVGALAAHGRVSIPLVLGAIAVVALPLDFGWYELGRRRGASVLAGSVACRSSPTRACAGPRASSPRHGVRACSWRSSSPG